MPSLTHDISFCSSALPYLVGIEPSVTRAAVLNDTPVPALHIRANSSYNASNFRS